MISTSILSRITKSNKTPPKSTNFNFFSSSSEIPSKLLHKDWLSPNQVQQLFASLQNPKTIVPSLNHYSKRKDYKPNEPLFTLILKRLAKAHLFADAQTVFDRVTSQRQCRFSDEFFRCAIRIFRPEKAIQILFDMPETYNCWPSSDTFNSVLDLLVSARMFTKVYEVFVSAPRLGVEVDSCSLNIMVKGLCECGSLDVALQVLEEFPHRKSRLNYETFEILVRYFCASGRVDEASGLVKRMVKEGIELRSSIFEALIRGLVGQKRVYDSMAVLERMRLEGCEPSGESYREIFSGVVDEGRFWEAREVVRKAVEAGLVPSFEDYECLIRGLCAEEDRIEDVGRVLEEMMRVGFVPNVRVWRVVVERLFDVKERVGS